MLNPTRLAPTSREQILGSLPPSPIENFFKKNLQSPRNNHLRASPFFGSIVSLFRANYNILYTRLILVARFNFHCTFPSNMKLNSTRRVATRWNKSALSRIYPTQNGEWNKYCILLHSLRAIALK